MFVKKVSYSIQQSFMLSLERPLSNASGEGKMRKESRVGRGSVETIVQSVNGKKLEDDQRTTFSAEIKSREFKPFMLVDGNIRNIFPR